MKKYESFLSEIFQFLEVKFSIYLNRHVFVMLLIVRSKAEFLLQCPFVLFVLFSLEYYFVICGSNLVPKHF